MNKRILATLSPVNIDFIISKKRVVAGIVNQIALVQDLAEKQQASLQEIQIKSGKLDSFAAWLNVATSQIGFPIILRRFPFNSKNVTKIVSEKNSYKSTQEILNKLQADKTKTQEELEGEVGELLFDSEADNVTKKINELNRAHAVLSEHKLILDELMKHVRNFLTREYAGNYFGGYHIPEDVDFTADHVIVSGDKKITDHESLVFKKIDELDKHFPAAEHTRRSNLRELRIKMLHAKLDIKRVNYEGALQYYQEITQGIEAIFVKQIQEYEIQKKQLIQKILDIVE